MKKFNRWLSVLMCLCMMSTSILGDLTALAEGGEVEMVVEPIMDETVLDDASEQEEIELELGGEETPAASTEADPVEEVQSPADEEMFSFGYATLLTDAALFESDDAEDAMAMVSQDGVVLVIGRAIAADLDRMQVTFVSEGIACIGWMDASVLRPMAEDEIDVFMNGITEAICYRDDVQYPLAEVAMGAAPAAEDVPVDGDAEVADEEAVADEEPVVDEEFTEGEDSAEGDESVAADVLVEDEEPVEDEESAEGEAADEDVDSSDSDAGVSVLDDEENIAMDDVAVSFALRGNDAMAVNGEDVDIETSVENLSNDIAVCDLVTERVMLAVGQEFPLEYTGEQVEFASDNDQVAVVSANGVITAIAVGSCEISMSAGGTAEVCNVTVTPAPGNVALTVEGGEFSLGSVGRAVASVDTISNVEFEYRFWTDAPSVIDIDEVTGEFTAIEYGTANIYVETYNGVSTYTVEGEKVETAAAVEVVAVPVEIIMPNDVIYMMYGKTFKLPVTFVDVRGDEIADVSYTLGSSSTGIVSVNNATGEVTGRGYGWSTITVTAGNLSASCDVGVLSATQKVTLHDGGAQLGTLNLGIDVEKKVEARLYWSSTGYTVYQDADYLTMGKFSVADETTASVNEQGVVSGLKKGETTLTFKSYSGPSVTVPVVVMSEPTEVRLNKEYIELGMGMSEKLEATFGEFELGKVEYSVENGKIASVSADGTVTALEEGVTTVTATSGKYSASCTVKVLPAPSGVKIGSDVIYMMYGKTFKLPVVFLDKNGNEFNGSCEYTLSTSRGDLVSVNNATGEVTGRGYGWSKITVTAGNLSASCDVGVLSATQKVTLHDGGAQLGTLNLGIDVEKKVEARLYWSSTGYTVYQDADYLTMGKFSVADETTATVNDQGVVTGLKKGETTLTFKSYSGPSVTVPVIIWSEPSDIYLEDYDALMGVDMTKQIEVSFNEYETSAVHFESEDTDIVSVDENGLMTAVSYGNTRVKVETENNLVAWCNVSVKNAPDTLTLDVTKRTIPVGMELDLGASVTYEGGSDCVTEFICTSSNANVATVSSEGIVTGKANGTATITVKTHNNLEAVCEIKVRPLANSIALNYSAYTLGVGQELQLTATIKTSAGSFILGADDDLYAHFESSNAEIAEVDSMTGKVEAIAEGTAEISVVTSNGKSAVCVIEVKPGAEWLEFDKTAVTLGVGQSMKLTCDKSAGSITTRTYESSDPSKLEVIGDDAVCTINAIAHGTVVVTATSSNGKTATCTVTILPEPVNVEFEEAEIRVGREETIQLPKVTVTSPLGECLQKVQYSADNSKVSISTDGEVTGIYLGTTVITATAYNGAKGTCTVTIVPKPVSINLTADVEVMAVGSQTQLKVEVLEEGRCTFYAVEEGVVEIDENGLVTAIGVGTAKIFATTYNGLSDNCTIEVKEATDSITISDSTLTLGVGMEATLTASIPENAYGTWKFSSRNESVAKVDAAGKLQALKEGTADIIVAVDGHPDVFDVCKLTVLPMPEKLTLSAEEMVLKTGANGKLEVTLTDADGDACYGTVILESSNSTAVRVDNDGNIEAVSAGEAVITARVDVDSELTACCKVTVVDAHVRFDVDELVLGEGETFELNVIIPEKYDNYSIVSSKPDDVKVDENGLITAVTAGVTATITAVNGDDTAQCVVEVAKRPSSVKLAVESKQMTIGDTYAIQAELQPAGSASRLTYETSNAKVAVVDENGVVEAVGYGTAEIKVKTYDEAVFAVLAIKAVYAPELIRFAELTGVTIAEGDSYVLEAPVMYHPDGECDVAYTLTVNGDAAKVEAAEDGRYIVYAVAEGEATLRLKTSNGKSASCLVTVVAAPNEIRFADEAITMGVEETYEPTVLSDEDARVSCEFSVESDDVVRIENGKLYAVAVGTATVTATSVMDGELTATVEVTVEKAPNSVVLTPDKAKLAVGEMLALSTEFADGTASAGIEYTSSDEFVVQVDAEGNAYAVDTGSAVITAKAYNGVADTCIVTVMEAPTALSVNPKTIVACVEDSVQLEVLFGAESEYANVYYGTDNTAVIDVNEDGLVTFKKIGGGVIYVDTFNGLSDWVAVTVEETPTSVAFEHEEAVILEGDRAKLGVVFDQGAACYELSSNDPETVRIAEDGCIEALKLGSAEITLTAPGIGESATCVVNVVNKLDAILVQPVKNTLELHEQTNLVYTLLPTNAIGTGLVSFDTENPEYVTIDPETGVVTGEAYGTATLTAITGDGKVGQCDINVLGGKRRMLIANYFGEDGDVGFLPFSYNNAFSMNEAFGAATVEGRKYDIAGPFSNMNRDVLLDNIDSHFADATEDDISVLYICAHGGTVTNWNYAFWTNPFNESEYITGHELMDHLEKIKGKIVVIQDSCYSGTLIDNCRNRADAQDGRIAFLCSSHATTNSCYWADSRKFYSVDIYTYSFLYGLGYNENQNLGAHGWTGDLPPADVNGDGVVAVQEAFNVAHDMTVLLNNQLAGNSQFYGNWRQEPQCYISAEMQSLPLFAR